MHSTIRDCNVSRFHFYLDVSAGKSQASLEGCICGKFQIGGRKHLPGFPAGGRAFGMPVSLVTASNLDSGRGEGLQTPAGCSNTTQALILLFNEGQEQ